MRTRGAAALSCLVVNQHAPASTVRVVAAVGGRIVIAVHIDAGPPTAGAIASITAMVARAGVGIAGASATGSTSRAGASRETPRVRPRTARAKVRRTTGAKARTFKT